MFGVMFRNDLNPTCAAEVSQRQNRDESPADLCNNLPDVLEIRAPAKRTLREELFNEPCPDIVPHLFKLLIDLSVVLVVLDELHDQRAVSQREQFCVLGLIRYRLFSRG